ncbi:MAG: helix-turn-helix transcriptional regulator [Desulfobaccales bacterium]
MKPQLQPEYLDLQGLAAYTSVSVRAWRDYLKRPDAPPVIRLPGKILVGRADVDAWLSRFRQVPGQGLGAIVDQVMEKIGRGGGA